MSKLSLTPNGAGTGTYTLASPNNNASHTLTLPKWQLYHQKQSLQA
jgi:hypothetical protein